MAIKRYRQGCGLARSLDVLGERWTLLVIRELLLGPKRYSDLATRLDGIPTNLLGDRLKQLVTDGLVTRRTLPPPAPATIYELTTAGRGLQPAVLALMAWGQEIPWTDAEASVVRAVAAWDAVQLLAANPVDRPATTNDITIALESGGETVRIAVRGRCIAVQDGVPENPDAVLAVDPRGFHGLRRGLIDLDEAVAGGRASVTGDIEAVREVLRLGRPTETVTTCP